MQNIITFVWPFILFYTVEKVMPFILDGRLNLASWSGVTKFLFSYCFYWGESLLLLEFIFALGGFTSLAAILIGFGVTGVKIAGRSQ